MTMFKPINNTYDIMFNGKKASEMGCYVVARPTIPSPSRKFSTTSVDTLDGNIYNHFDTFDDIEIEISFNFMESSEGKMLSDFRSIKEWLLGETYCELQLLEDKDVFYKCKNVVVGDLSRSGNKIGNFEVTFTCEPYSYLTTGTIAREWNGIIHNDYSIMAKPIWIFEAYSNFQEGEGYPTGGYMEIVSIPKGATMSEYLHTAVDMKPNEKLYIDTELGIIYDDDGNATYNSRMFGFYSSLWIPSGEFRSYTAGQVALTPPRGSITYIPRWRRL